jgi:predicted GIY-YIG superfamily endonuclease
MEVGDETPTALYRFLDASDSLLYVGITNNIKGRFASHAADKPWWPDVARKTVEWHPTRSDAANAEWQAIRREAPRYNIQGAVKLSGISREVQRSSARANAREDPGLNRSRPPDMWCMKWWAVAERYVGGVDDEQDAADFLCPLRSSDNIFGLWRSSQREFAQDGDRFPLVWAQDDSRGGPLASRRFICSFSAHFDITFLPDDGQFGPGQQALQEQLLRSLRDMGRCAFIRPGRAAIATGFDNRIEAQVAGAVLSSIAFGHTDHAQACLDGLEGQRPGTTVYTCHPCGESITDDAYRRLRCPSCHWRMSEPGEDPSLARRKFDPAPPVDS